MPEKEGVIAPKKGGLEDIVASTSSICFIDGHQGRLIYRGIDIHDLVEYSSFEEVTYLLWHGKLPTQDELAQLCRGLSANRNIHSDVIALMKTIPKGQNPMSVLRTMVSLLSAYDADSEDNSNEANMRKSIRLVAKMATVVAAFERIRKGQDVIPPDPKLSQAANFLYMLRGETPDKRDEKIIDICLILHADHEFNASTFSGRVTAATMSDIYSAITSAIGTLKGPLHGGANEEVMKMLIQIGEASKAEEYIESALAAKQKIMGFGHRVYKTEDPRVRHLRSVSQELAEKSGNLKWYQISHKVEEVMVRHLGSKGIYPNVDFYSASVYYMMGIPIDLFTPIFAISRVSGWTAHILEQYANNRLIRPISEYVGAMDVPYVSIQNRQ